MRQLSFIFIFYKPYILWSLGLNAFFIITLKSLIPIVFIKFILVGALWYFHTETNANRKLIFYKNIGISNFKLFSSIFFIDLLISFPILLIIKEFI